MIGRNVLLLLLAAVTLSNAQEDSAAAPVRLNTGLSIGGGGMLGLPLSLNIRNRFIIDLLGSVRPNIVTTEEKEGIPPDIIVAAGFTFITKTIQREKALSLRGISLKHGIGFGPLSPSFMSVSRVWVRQKRRSYLSFELGGGLMCFQPNYNFDYLQNARMYGAMDLDNLRFLPMLYYKFDIGFSALRIAKRTNGENKQ
jgi:hypothetical protein